MTATLRTAAVLPDLVAPRRSSRATLWWARIVCLSVFGPYVAGSARPEQMAVFASLAVVLIFGWPSIVQARSFALMPFACAWGALVAVVLIGTAWRPFDPGFYGPQPVSHGLSACLLPLALIVVTWYWTLRAEARDLIRAVAPLIVTGMTANAGIALVQAESGQTAVLGWLPRFWGASGSAASVALSAGANSRYTGVFNQPAEAGIAYGVALLCLIWLARSGIMRRGLPAALCAAVLVAGGVLTVSKIFLLGALPLTVVTVAGSRGRWRAVGWASAAGGMAWLLASAGLLPAWPGGAVIAQLAHPPGALVTTYSAGRYGPGATLAAVISDVMGASPAYGFGAGGLSVAYDSLWAEMLVYGGVAAVILAAAVVGMLAYRWAVLRGVLGRPERALCGGVLVLAAAASLGLPSLTADRACTLLWLILGMLAATQPYMRPVT